MNTGSQLKSSQEYFLPQVPTACSPKHCSTNAQLRRLCLSFPGLIRPKMISPMERRHNPSGTMAEPGCFGGSTVQWHGHVGRDPSALWPLAKVRRMMLKRQIMPLFRISDMALHTGPPEHRFCLAWLGLARHIGRERTAVEGESHLTWPSRAKEGQVQSTVDFYGKMQWRRPELERSDQKLWNFVARWVWEEGTIGVEWNLVKIFENLEIVTTLLFIENS